MSKRTTIRSDRSCVHMAGTHQRADRGRGPLHGHQSLTSYPNKGEATLLCTELCVHQVYRYCSTKYGRVIVHFNKHDALTKRHAMLP